jgi:hypothetical protein
MATVVTIQAAAERPRYAPRFPGEARGLGWSDELSYDPQRRAPLAAALAADSVVDREREGQPRDEVRTSLQDSARRRTTVDF